MDKIEKKRQNDKDIVALMIRWYCKKKHGGKERLCDSCMELYDYAMYRIDHCPFMETKTFCSNCKSHCYKPQMREKIKDVMRFSGPRLLLSHPFLAVRHVIDTIRNKDKAKVNGRQKSN